MRLLSRLALSLLALVATFPLDAQELVATGVERESSHTRSWRLLYDNDFFAATDRYFTQGIYSGVRASGDRPIAAPARAHHTVAPRRTIRRGVRR